MALFLRKMLHHSLTFTHDNFYTRYYTLDRGRITFRLENILYAKLSSPARNHRIFDPYSSDSQSLDRCYCLVVSPDHSLGARLDGPLRPSPPDIELVDLGHPRCQLAIAGFVEQPVSMRAMVLRRWPCHDPPGSSAKLRRGLFSDSGNNNTMFDVYKFLSEIFI